GIHVKVVGFTTGLKSLAGPYVFCSVNTARGLLGLSPTQVTYVLGKCHDPATAAVVANRLKEDYGNVSAYTKTEFSRRSQWHWLTKPKAGIALGYAAALGLFVGAVVTSQTLYAATAASLREFAVLRALGIPRWRMAMLVMNQAFWIGAIGITLALPVPFPLPALADPLGGQTLVPGWRL